MSMPRFVYRVSPLVASLIQPCVPLAVLPIDPMAAIGPPSECLLLKNMFDPKQKIIKTILIS